MKKVVHLTSVHARKDIRILLKETSSLAKAGFDVSLIVADGFGDDIVNNVKIIDIGTAKHRFDRILNTTKKVFSKAMSLDADIYHFHDPELISTGLKLKKAGKKVVFDSHEDFASDLLTKTYIPRFLRMAMSTSFKVFDSYACKKFDSIITATPAIAELYNARGCKTVVINNYPIIDELSIPPTEKENSACFVGAQTPIRGVKELVNAIDKLDGKLYLAGPVVNESFKTELSNAEGWNRVTDLGIIPRNEVAEILGKCKVGLVTYLPAPNHIDAQPNKLFEYMSVGLPVVASHFPLWKQIVEDNYCGICVDPANPDEIAKAIKFIFDNPDEAKKMGENGIKAINDIYNWSVEEAKLVSFYNEMLND
ncbi:glycosyltransferase WbpH [Psychromonas marina]|uniref:Glycosyltransferase WbpH n=1 Tax=Psychromonas marina TaxID=88364 RepID=A0ABQ6DWT0_9GAMM|nr:glycosyltransferase [Psychromonas marina]GLS89612.1 glycosyltransferase WbpH [Psychromonas marina]